MDRDGISNLVYWLLRQSSSNSDIVAATDMVTQINNAYTQVVADLLPDAITTYQSVAIHRTTRASGSGTSLTVSDATGFSQNTWIVIYEGSRYEILRLNTIVTKTFTLASPGVIYSGFTTAAVVVPLSFIITSTREIKACIYRHIDATTYNDVYVIDPMTDTEVYTKCMAPEEYSTLRSYALLSPTELFVWPIPQYEGYLEIYYNANSAYSLAAGDATTILDTQHQYLIVLWILMQCYLRYRQAEMFKVTFEVYQQMLLLARNELNRKYSSAAPFDLDRKV